MLDVSGNDLSSIHKDTFLNLRKLQTLDLSDNGLTNLANGTFHGPIDLGGWTADFDTGGKVTRVYKLPGLKTLDLSDNGMVKAAREIWDGDCVSQVPTLTITPGNPDLTTCQ